MKKWLRRTLIAALLVGLTLAALYESATHVGRGWLRGEAFYEGRPTSWWRGRIDEWMERFDSVEDADRSMDRLSIRWVKDDKFVPNKFFTREGVRIPIAPLPRPQIKNWTSRLLDAIGPDDGQNVDWPPLILIGYPESKPVLDELAGEIKYRNLVIDALENIQYVQENGGDGCRPAFIHP